MCTTIIQQKKERRSLQNISMVSLAETILSRKLKVAKTEIAIYTNLDSKTFMFGLFRTMVFSWKVTRLNSKNSLKKSRVSLVVSLLTCAQVDIAFFQVLQAMRRMSFNKKNWLIGN